MVDHDHLLTSVDSEVCKSKFKVSVGHLNILTSLVQIHKIIFKLLTSAYSIDEIIKLLCI